jgi:hypothetical protein
LRVKWEHVYTRPTNANTAGRVSHLGTPNSYDQRVPKQRYSPPSPEVAAEIDAVVELHENWQKFEAEYRRRVAALIDQEGAWRVPVAHVADRIGVERKTVYRHAGRSMT